MCGDKKSFDGASGPICGRYFEKIDSDGAVGMIALQIIGLLIGGGLVFSHLYKIIFISIAPKLYLIEYFMK